LRVFENKVLRRIFETKREEITGGCRKLHNEELHNLTPHVVLLGYLKEERLIEEDIRRYGEC
jgi:hypothetical protein